MIALSHRCAHPNNALLDNVEYVPLLGGYQAGLVCSVIMLAALNNARVAEDRMTGA